MKSTKEELPEYTFREGEYLATLGAQGITYKDEDEEITIPYSDVKFSRVLSRKRADDIGNEKLYLTAPFPRSGTYNRFCFKEKGETYHTHEFSSEEKAKMERAITAFAVPVVDKRKSTGIAKAPMKVFREDGGFAHKIVVSSAMVLLALVVGAALMFLLNYFFKTDTETLAIVFGVFCVPCLAAVIIKSQELGSKVKVYEKGVYLKIRSKSGYGGTASPFAIETAYFNWDEVECVERVQSQVQYRVVFRLGHCVYSVPDFNGLYDYIFEHFPEMCKVEE